MVKRFFILLAVCFLLMPSPAANADVVSGFEWITNFYFWHSKWCVEVGRNFYVNGENGSLSSKRSPGSKDVVKVFKNNSTLFILCVYNYKGEYWGRWTSRGHNEGWVPMNQLMLEYDHIFFTEEHGEEFYPYTDGHEALKTAEKVILWSWPYSGEEVISIIEPETIENVTFSHAYKDNQGREWVYVNRIEYGQHGNHYSFYGRSYNEEFKVWTGVNAWICINDPSNSDIPAFNPPRPMPWQPADTSKSGLLQIVPSIPLLVILLVTVLTAVTAVLIRVFWKPNKGS